MALKDLKSDLSKFRMPKKDPLVDKKIDSVNTKTNQTPLSSMVDSAPKIPRSQTTTNKEGVEPIKFDNSSKFLGETTPSKMNNSSNFLGETTPQKVDNSSKFLGETTPTPSDKQSQFLGETTLNKSDITSKFLGETNPNRFDNSSNFLGETTPSPANNESRFLGETNPNKFDNSSNFLGETTPTPANNESRFLGETTPTLSDRESNFLGETTPTPFSNTSNFLGETTPTPSNKESNFLGETNPTKFEFNPNHSDNGVTPTNVNYFQDIHAKGFTSNFGGVEDTKFIGVNPNNTIFNSTNSRYSNIGDSTFTLGRTYEQSFDSAGRLNSGETGFGIGKGQAKRNSPSFLDLQYAKFNLKDDSFNMGLGLFRHPLILRGIQRKGISKGEPQTWGIGGVTFDDGLIRGGVITSTVRALVDVARVGGWLTSVEGVLWSAKQVGLQRTNKFGKIWTPVNMLTSIGSQHIGLKPMRSGLIPFNDETVKYETLHKGLVVAEDAGFLAKKAASVIVDVTPLDILYDKFTKWSIGDLYWKEDKKGGFDSLYGIGITVTSRFENTVDNKGKRGANSKAGFTTLNPINIYTDSNKYIESNSITDIDISKSTTNGRRDSIRSVVESNELFNGGGSNILDANGNTDGNTPGAEVIQDYQTIAYGKMPNRVAGDTQLNDFRSLLVGNEAKRAELEDYGTNNINKRVNFGNPGKLGESEDRINWFNTSKTSAGNQNRFDPINASNIGEENNDLVHLWFRAEGGSKVQFRGTAKGITETFSPSWDSIKYNGRADQAYKYTTFERSLSFNFQVYATSRIEMKPIWSKLNYLSTMTMPSYKGGSGYQGTLVYFRLGNLYNNKLAFIESLSYTMSDETPWEISMLGSKEFIGELPMGIDVSIGLKILGNVRPELGKKVYDWGF